MLKSYALVPVENPSIKANFTLWGPQVVERQLDHFQETSKHVMKLK